SKPIGNTKNNKISLSSSSNKNNKVEDQSRSVKSKKNKKNYVAKVECNAYVMQSMLNVNSKSVCAICNECLFDANHDKCVFDYGHDVNVLSKSKPAKCKNKKQIWKPKGKVYTEISYKWNPTKRTFTIVGNKFPLTGFTSTKVVPLKETTIKSVLTPTQGIKVYIRGSKEPKSIGSSSKSKIIESRISNISDPNQSGGSTISNVPSSFLIACRLSKLFCGIWTLDAPSIWSKTTLSSPISSINFMEVNRHEVLGYIAVSTSTPSSTTIDQDAPSPSTSQTPQELPSQVITLSVEEADHDIEVAHMDNNHYFELNEFERLEVWELVPRLDHAMIITLKWIYKVQLDELRGVEKQGSTPRESIRQETKVPQPSSPPLTHVADEAASTDNTVYKEWEDRIERATTTASSLEAEQDSGGADAQTRFETASIKSNDPPFSKVNTLESEEDNMKLMELMKFYTKLSYQKDQPEDQLGVLSAAKILADATRVHIYSIKRRAVSTRRGEVSTGSRIISTAKETVSTAGVSMPVSTASMVQESNSSPRATKDKGKAIMTESEPEQTTTKLRERQERARYEATIRLQEQQDKKESQGIAKDVEIAHRLQEEINAAKR
nr:uncharacterized mitochondrial protein AtMg00820-like [Tanacetum cinerariifolium]